MRRWLSLALIAATTVVLVAVASVWFLWQQQQQFLDAELKLTEPTVYAVTPGQGLSTVLQDWHSLGYINRPPPLLTQRMRLLERPVTVLLGHYRLDPGLTVTQSIDMLISGKAVEYRWQIIEGTTLGDILATMRADTRIVYDVPVVEGRADYPAFAAALGMDMENPEGMFFADTYHFFAGSKASVMLARASQQRQTVLAEEWQARDNNVPYESDYQALIMASIIEKETGQPHERPRIAGVFTSRLNLGMRLQTDPTVIYGIGDAYTGDITRKHLRTATDYNTYTISGLPPTPIAAVGRAAIHAALHPEADGSLFFVARGDGSHTFSTTLAEHERAVRQFQLGRKNNYRSSPKK